MSDILSIGASGLRAYQTALTTVSENIANAGTAGYARRATSLREVTAPGAVQSATVNGLGVAVTGITRAGDNFRAAEVRTANSDLAKTETGATWLERIENALSNNQLGDRLTDFFNSTRAVAADPTATAPRTVMLESASNVAAAFASTGGALAAATADLDATTDDAVNQLNGLTTALAKVNAGLGRSPPGTSGVATMLDERDRLLESISAITDVDATIDAAGRTTLRAGGGGALLVQGESAGTVTHVANSEGAISFAVLFDDNSAVLTPNGGALAGMADGAQRIANARASFETMAGDFAEGVNTVQAQGRDLSGNPGEPMFTAGDPPSQITLALVDPRGIAAASVGGGARDNSNLAGFDTLRRTGAFESGLTDMTTSNASALAARRTVSAAQTSIRDSAVASRDATSGVNIDEEAVDLLRFQQAYSASSRVIQVARETLQSILDIR